MWTGLRMERKSYEIPLSSHVLGHVPQALSGWNLLGYGRVPLLPSNVWTYDREMAVSPLSLLLWILI